jgi:hypothetical protein
MKKLILIACLLSLSIFSFSQQITRGPDIGEIYFLGPAATDVLYGAIYRSIDFGVTAVCVDSISAMSHDISSIVADKTQGSLYFVTLFEDLYYSNNFGIQGSWILRNGEVYVDLASGRNEGELFNAIVSHSEDYGVSFINHSFNGFFGSLKDVEIDNSNNIGYCIGESFGVADTQYFFITYDNYENLEVINKFNFASDELTEISRGQQAGELFLINKNTNLLYFTDDYGQTWDLKNSFTCPILPIEGITGGRQDGEIYLLVVYRQFMGFVRHVYIHHSLDYGETFTVYHPVSIGNDPVYANFEAGDTLGKPPFEVQFTDLSSGGLGYWEWDFNNDGTTDSYEQNPIFIYNDTGYFSVELKGSYSVITDSAIRYNYIHVTNLTNVSEAEQQGNVNLACFPNPFNENVTITLTSTVDDDPGYITIFDVSGLFVNEIKLEKTSNKYEYITNWDGGNQDGNKVKQGVYYLLSKNKSSSIKIVLIN